MDFATQNRGTHYQQCSMRWLGKGVTEKSSHLAPKSMYTVVKNYVKITQIWALKRMFIVLKIDYHVCIRGFPVKLNVNKKQSWLGWLSGLSAGLWSKQSLVQFPVRAQAWVSDQAPSRVRARDNHTVMSPSLFSSLPSPISVKINKIF